MNRKNMIISNNRFLLCSVENKEGIFFSVYWFYLKSFRHRYLKFECLHNYKIFNQQIKTMVRHGTTDLLNKNSIYNKLVMIIRNCSDLTSNFKHLFDYTLQIGWGS